MRLKQYLVEAKEYWKYPSEKDLKSDYEEYEKKLYSKWQSRANQIGAKFPIFLDYMDFKNQILGTMPIVLKPSLERRLPNTSYCETIECIEDMVNDYKRPRDVQRILKGFQIGEKIPYPIILKGNRGYYRLTGNTRMNVARILNIPIKILIIDVSD